MPGYPLVLTQLEHVRVVVIGGGSVAERKTKALIEAGAHPIVISPALTPVLQQWHGEGKLAWLAHRYTVGELAGAGLVIAATNERETNAQVAAEARERGILTNIGDAPEEGNFTTVASVRRGDLLLTVTTQGASPSLTARIRRELEATYGEEYALLLELLRDVRDNAARHLPPEQRTRLLRQLASDEVIAWVRAGETQRVQEFLQSWFGDYFNNTDINVASSHS